MATDYDGWRAGAYGLQGVASLAGAFAESEALRAQSSYQRTLAAINQRLESRRAESVIKAGEKQVSKIEAAGKRIAGSQRVAAAAQGIDSADGSAKDLMIDTESAVQADVLNMRNNAWRESWGIKTQASFAELASEQEDQAASNKANSTLLTGGLNAAGSFADAGMALGKSSNNQNGTINGVNGYSGKWSREELDSWFKNRRLR